MLIVSFSSRISPFTSTVIFFDRSPVATAFVTSAIFRTWPVRLPAMKLTLSVRSFHVPATPFTWAWPPSLPSVPTSRATRVTSLANDAELIDHPVDRAGGAQELALQRAIADLQGHRLRQVALGHAADHAGRFAGRMHQVVDQLVDRFDRLFPEAIDLAQRQALAQLAFLADDAAESRQLAGHALIELDDVVERVGHLAGHAGPVERQTGPAAALLQGQKAVQQSVKFGGAQRFFLLKDGHEISTESQRSERRGK